VGYSYMYMPWPWTLMCNNIIRYVVIDVDVLLHCTLPFSVL